MVQFSHPEPIPRPSHATPPPNPPNMQMYTVVPPTNGAPTNGHQQVNTTQPTYYSNGTGYPAPMPQYSIPQGHAVSGAPSNNTYGSPYLYSNAVSAHQVWHPNGGMVYTPNGQPAPMARPMPESPVDTMLANAAASPPPRATPPLYSHPQYTNSPPVAPAAHQPLQHANYGYTWTPEQLRAMQQQQQQQQQQQPAAQQPVPRTMPAQAQPQPYRESVIPIAQAQPLQHSRVQAQSASPMPTMSPTMMHMTGSPVPYAGPYGDMFNVGGSPAYAHVQHSPGNPAAINPKALSQPSVVEPPKEQQPQADTIYLYKQYMQPQMMDAAPAQTAKRLIDLLTAEDTPLTDPHTRLWLLTR